MIAAGRLAQYPFTPRYYVIAGHRLAYLDEGSGPVVVCVHGNPSWSYLYRHLTLALRERCRVIVPDHLGCGFSDKPQDHPYRLHNHIENLTLLLEHLQVERCTLVMHDWGGAIGMGWATRFSARVAGLVVCNTAAFRSRQLPLRIAICRWPVLGALLVRGLNGFAGAAVHMAVRKKMEPAVARSFLAPYDTWANRIAVHRFVRDIPMHAGHPSWKTLVSVEQGLSGLQEKPMLLCWGGADFCFHEGFFREWLRRFPQARHRYFPEAGHYLLEDAGEEIIPEITAFITACSERTP